MSVYVLPPIGSARYANGNPVLPGDSVVPVLLVQDAEGRATLIRGAAVLYEDVTPPAVRALSAEPLQTSAVVTVEADPDAAATLVSVIEEGATASADLTDPSWQPAAQLGPAPEVLSVSVDGSVIGAQAEGSVTGVFVAVYPQGEEPPPFDPANPAWAPMTQG